MDNVNKIKKAYKQSGKINSAAKVGQCSWATAKKIIETPSEKLSQRGKRNKVSKFITNEVIEAIEKILFDEEEKKAHRKQRHKTTAILIKLKEAGVYQGPLRHLKRIVAEIHKNHCRSLWPLKSFLDLSFENGKYLSRTLYSEFKSRVCQIARSHS